MQKMGYFIRDNNNCFPWGFGLSVKNMDGTGTCWDYIADRNINYGYSSKLQAETQLKKFEELQEIAQIPNLSWEIIYTNYREYPRIKDAKVLIMHQDIPKGCATKHRKSVAGIIQKYNAIFKGIEIEWRRGKAV